MKNFGLGEKGALLGLPVLIIAVIAHFIVFMAAEGMSAGFMSGLMWAIGLIILTVFTSISYALASKKKEGILANYVYNLALLVIATVLVKIYMTWIQPRLGL